MASVIDDRVGAELRRLVALSPGDGRIASLVRLTCARAVSLPPLPIAVDVAVAESDAQPLVADFAEQFSIDVSGITDSQRAELFSALGADTFTAVVLMYIGDFLPRVRAGLDALGFGRAPADWVDDATEWDRGPDPSDAVFNGFLPTVARLRALDPVTSELIRLRGATQHNCRLCKSLREGNALDAGGSETMYSDIERYEASGRLSDRHKAALRYVDALIWAPARIPVDVAAGVRAHFSDAEAIEMTLDVMRNASNKIAVALGGDAPRVEQGTERYLIDADGQTVFG